MRIIITGASGFIGRYLVPVLATHSLLILGRKQVVFNHPDYHFVRADLSDSRSWGPAVENFKPDACIHLAWEGLPDYSFKTCQKNFSLATHFYDTLAGIGCPKVLTSGSCWEYGALQGAAKETDLSIKPNLFASFKTALRIVGESLASDYGLNFIWGRLFFVYGPGQRENSLIPYCCNSFKQNKPPKLNSPGNVNDFIYVEDAATAIASLIETPDLHGIFNIGSGTPTPVSDVCNIVAKAMGVTETGRKNQSPLKKRGNWANISLITKKTGWKPSVSIETGIKTTITQMKGNL